MTEDEPREMKPIPREARNLWQRSGRDVELGVPPKQGAKWTDDDVEIVIRAVPEEYQSYEALAAKLERSPGAIRIKKDQVMRLLHQEPYASQLATDGNHKHADWKQADKVLRDRGYYALPISQQMHFARHLPQPSASYRGDHTQVAVNQRRDRGLIGGKRSTRKANKATPDK
jgi:hypothetical protein